MGFYKTLIKKATGVYDPDRIARIEDVMRENNGGVLDHLTRAEFGEQARLAKAVIVWSNTEGATA